MTNASTSGITLRRASVRDLSGVEDLLTRTKLPRGGVDALIDSFIVAEDDGRLIGVAGVERLIAESNENGIAELYLLTTTAEKYFPILGFAKISREATPAEIQETDEFTDLCPSTATVMRRVLKT
jgi:amino-acid N-acetyltransferase